jgi:hypothetical protein
MHTRQDQIKHLEDRIGILNAQLEVWADKTRPEYARKFQDKRKLERELELVKSLQILADVAETFATAGPAELKAHNERIQTFLTRPGFDISAQYTLKLMETKQRIEIKISELEGAQRVDDSASLGRRRATQSASVAQTAASAEMPRSWQEIEISFLSDERVQICSGHDRKTHNYGELGFADRRSGKPNRAWVMLREAAKKNGTIPRPSPGKDRAMIQKRMQEIRKKLRIHLRIETDPIPFNGSSYQTSFKIYRSPCAET